MCAMIVAFDENRVTHIITFVIKTFSKMSNIIYRQFEYVFRKFA